jgi:hypothetical protein
VTISEMVTVNICGHLEPNLLEASGKMENSTEWDSFAKKTAKLSANLTGKTVN